VTATTPLDTRPDPSAPGPLLEADSIHKRYAGIAALTDVSIQVGAGELVGLLGPNGAGKTTLFDCLTGKQRPNSGTVSLDGEDLLKEPVHRRAQRGVARTFQRMELFSGLTVREHLVVGYRARHGGRGIVRDAAARFRPDPAERARCDEVLDLVGLGPDAERPIEALSLGRGRLVELARALVTDPRILFLDEPSSGLDRTETLAMGTVLLEVQAETNVAIVLVEHDIPMVQRLAGRLYVLDAGSVIAQGEVDAVLADPRVRAAYLGAGA
jgi:branched-chain amino acid transport system ATP-binding protein